MKKTILATIALIFCLASCKKEKVEVPVENTPTKEIITKLKKAGFDTSEGFRKYNNGYIVEYDIFFTEDEINTLSINQTSSKNSKTEHYRSTNIVGGTPRQISVYMDPVFGTYMQNAFDLALARYNNSDISLTFKRSLSSNADIKILAIYENSNLLGISGGFPTNNNPANTISLNTFYYNNNSQRTDAVTTIAHEIGHAIGFRHTDYMDRRFSCGSGPVDDGPSEAGAIKIPGTSQYPTNNSWMLACSNNSDRPFTSEDLISLKAVYPKVTGTIRNISSAFRKNQLVILPGYPVITQYLTGGAGSVVANNFYVDRSLYDFIFELQNDGTYAIKSKVHQNIYLRMDATGVINSGGKVNCNYGISSMEKFKITKQSDGTYTIESVAFPNYFLSIQPFEIVSTNTTFLKCNLGVSGPLEKFIITPSL